MKIWAVTRKNVIEWLREPQLLLLVVFAPLAFLVATIVGYPRPFLVTHRLLVVNAAPAGGALLDDLRALAYPDGRPAFQVEEIASAPEGEAALRDQSAALLLVISAAQPAFPGAPAWSVTLRGDALNSRYYEAGALLNDVIRRHVNRLAGRVEVVGLVDAPLAHSGPQYEYDLYVPGMIVFALLLLIPQTAMLLGREVRAGTLKRLRLAPLSAFELLAGVTLAQMAIAVLLVLVVFGGGLVLGFHNQGSLGLALLVGLAVSLSAIGQGVGTACFVANDSQAVNYGSMLTMMQVFISGSFFPLPAPTLLTIAGHEMTLFDLIPATHGMTLLQQVLSYGAGWNEIAFRLTVMVALSVIYFLAGVAVFRRLQMR